MVGTGCLWEGMVKELMTLACNQTRLIETKIIFMNTGGKGYLSKFS